MASTTSSPRRADDIRRHNLGLLLTHVHRDGVLTRAALTQRLGMSRSTIGVLVADLAALGLLSEHVPTGGERSGRPSHVVGPSDNGPYAIAVDVDIAHVCVAAVGLGGRILARRDVVLRSHATPRAVVKAVARTVPKLSALVPAGAWPLGIGVSIPGTVDSDGVIGFAPNLSWRHVPLRAMLDEALKEALEEAPAEQIASSLPVLLGNDADLSALAEHRHGAARGYDDLVYLLGRAGVGAGIVVGGKQLLGRAGRAGEIGHTVMNPNGRPCQCGKRGCVETYIGDGALLGGVRGSTSVADVLASAAKGDTDAIGAVRDVAQWLGRVLASVVNILAPQRVIMGGSFAGVLELSRADVLTALAGDVFEGVIEDDLVTGPELGDDSALIGAAEIVFAPLLEDPLSVSRPA